MSRDERLAPCVVTFAAFGNPASRHPHAHGPVQPLDAARPLRAMPRPLRSRVRRGLRAVRASALPGASAWRLLATTSRPPHPAHPDRVRGLSASSKGLTTTGEPQRTQRPRRKSESDFLRGLCVLCGSKFLWLEIRVGVRLLRRNRRAESISKCRQRRTRYVERVAGGIRQYGSECDRRITTQIAQLLALEPEIASSLIEKFSNHRQRVGTSAVCALPANAAARVD